MAIMIPDSCPARATAGEKRAYGLLRDHLPDNFVAWYEPAVEGRFPDFTLLADSFGLLVLEVKGLYPKQLGRVTDQDVELLRSEGGREHVERHKNPIRQVREYLFGLLDELGRPEVAILRDADGDHRGRPCFPCGYGVLFTNITRAQLDEAGLSAVLPPGRVICRDELAALEGAGDREAIRRLRRLFPASFPFDPLTEDQLGTIRGVIHKEVVVRARPATRASVSPGKAPPEGAVAVDVLDARQEQLAQSVAGGHHVFFGVAGSGKTVLLLARARLIARQDPSRRVLVLCYNRALIAHLAAQAPGEPGRAGIEVRHFHSWAARRTGLRNRYDEPFDGYERRVVEAMLCGHDVWAEADKYDAILIDERHDFEPDWFRCAVGQLKGGPSGDLMIAVDGEQSLYGRDRSFTWKSVGVQAAGRTMRLSRNYRNATQIRVMPAEGSRPKTRWLPTLSARQSGLQHQPIAAPREGATVFPQPILRAEWVAVCQELGFQYVVRIKPEVTVSCTRYRGVLRKYPTHKGMAHLLKDVAYREDQRVRHHIAIRWRPDLPKTWDKPWFLMIDLERKAEDLCRLYGRRRSIEELFRDGKSKRNGQSLRDTQIGQPERFDRLLLVVTLAYLVLVDVGLRPKLDLDPSAWCTARRPRECSVFTIGKAMVDRLDGWTAGRLTRSDLTDDPLGNHRGRFDVGMTQQLSSPLKPSGTPSPLAVGCPSG